MRMKSAKLSITFGLIVLIVSLAISQPNGLRVQSADKAALFTNITARVISVKKGFLATNDVAILRFASRFGITNVVESDENPLCCISIEPLPVASQIVGEQFVAIHYGYAVVQVTSSKALNIYVDRLVELGCPTNQLPSGLITSFK